MKSCRYSQSPVWATGEVIRAKNKVFESLTEVCVSLLEFFSLSDASPWPKYCAIFIVRLPDQRHRWKCAMRTCIKLGMLPKLTQFAHFHRFHGLTAPSKPIFPFYDFSIQWFIDWTLIQTEPSIHLTSIQTSASVPALIPLSFVRSDLPHF